MPDADMLPVPNADAVEEGSHRATAGEELA